MHNFFYLLKQGAKGVTKNKLMTFSCIGVLVACMMLIGGSVLITASVNNLAGELQQVTDIVAYLEEDVSNTTIQAVDDELDKIENIIEITYSSKEDVLEDMKEKMGEQGNFFEGLEAEANPFPATYVLRLENPEETKETVRKVEAIPGILEVKASFEVADALTQVKQAVYYSGATVVIILVLVSLAIITNTIKITIYSRRREINIMKYVGATDGFIRFPFIIEGMIIGILAAIFAFVLLGVTYTYLLQWAGQNAEQLLLALVNSAVPFKDLGPDIFIGFTILGVAIGTLSSGVFVRKHLKV